MGLVWRGLCGLIGEGEEEKLFPLMLATISNPALLIPSRLSNFYRPYLTNEYRVLGFTHRNRVSPIIMVVVTK
jgi:hypothetical protein